MRPHINTVTIDPITTTIRGLSTEDAVRAANGLGEEGVVACDHITTIAVVALAREIGRLLDEKRPI